MLFRSEYTNAARGGGWNHLLSYTNELRGSPVGTKQPSRPSRWHFVLALRPHRHIANRSAESHLVLFRHRFLPELGRRARMATNAPTNSCRPCPCNRCRLTLPSRGCPKGCAFCAPLMSNVRALAGSKTARRNECLRSKPCQFNQGPCFAHFE